MSTLNLETASRVLTAGQEAAAGIGVAMNIAVVDTAGNLVAFSRMDGAWLGSTDAALKKAKTSALFPMPSSALGELSQPGGPIYGIEVTNGGLITFGGGLPLTAADGTVVGAIGVSGGMVEQDVAVAEAGAKAV
ncbi:heme-binding protein [Catenulispora subtropica]|uniref:Heme-binding protein n=1 Tax=Catenulispora subtropica TaxID=450798 RepID=A0ABP5ETZ5_9ACTN